MSLSSKTNNIERSVYDFFMVCGDVGGMMEVFIAIAAFMVIPFHNLDFKLIAIQKLFKIDKKEKLKRLGALSRLRLILNIFPDKYYKRLIERGTLLLNREMDIVHVRD